MLRFNFMIHVDVVVDIETEIDTDFFPLLYLWWAEVFKGPPNRHNLDTGSIIINLYFENIGAYKVGKNRNYPRVGQVITYLEPEHCQ